MQWLKQNTCAFAFRLMFRGHKVLDCRFKQTQLKFAWAASSDTRYYRSLIIYNVPNGISTVQVMTRSGQWVEALKNGRCGQQRVLPSGDLNVDTGRYLIRVTDVHKHFSGTAYGTYRVPPPQGVKWTLKVTSQFISKS